MNHYAMALIQLPLVRESRGECIRNPADAALACADIQDLAQETFQVLILNAKNYMINRVCVSLGIADSTLVHPREVFRQAIVDNAASVVLVHNHPSGDPTPSSEDLRVTRQMVEGGRVLGIPVTDHVVVGRKTETSKGYISIKEVGLCDFGK